MKVFNWLSLKAGFLAKSIGMSGLVRRRSKECRKATRLNFEQLESRLTPAVSLVNSPAWIPMGPFPTFGGQTEGLTAQDNPVSGAINRIVAHPSNPDILYIGAVNGGVWRTKNATASSPSWQPLSDSWDGLSIGALEMDTTDPTGNTLIAGIGLFSSLGRTGGSRTGAYKTTDGGASWQALSPSLQGKNIVGAAIRGNTILVAVNSADNYQFANLGIFRSTNGGNTFTQVSVGSGASTGLPAGIVYDLAADPVNPNVFYANMQYAASSGGTDGIYKTSNAGASWTKVSTAAMDSTLDPVGTPAVNIKIAVGRANNVFVAASDNATLSGMYYSPDGGLTWQTMGAPSASDGNATNGAFPGGKPAAPQNAPGSGTPGGQGNTHFSLAADPSNPTMVYLGGDRQDDPFPNSLGARNYSGRLFRGDASKAAGSQWTAITNNFADPDGSGPAQGTSPHADSRDMAFDASGNLIESDDGGIYRRSSPRSSTGTWSSVNGNLQVTEFHSVAYDSTSNVIFGGAQDTGTTHQQPDGTWRELTQGDGGVVDVDATSTPGQSIRYGSYQNFGGFNRSYWNSSGSMTKTEYPALVVNGSGGKDLYAVDKNIGFYQQFQLNRVDPSRLVIPTQSVYVSTDRGETLADVTGSTNQTLTAVAYGGRKSGSANPDLLYFGGPGNANYLSGAKLFAIKSSGGAVSAIAAYKGSTPKDIAVDPNDYDSIFVLDDSGKVWGTSNGGVSWTNLTGDLPAIQSSAGYSSSIMFATVAGLPSIVVGAGLGQLYRTFLTAPGKWSLASTGLPRAPIDDIRYDSTDDVVVIGTQGRGAFKAVSYTVQPGELVITGDDIANADDTILLARNTADSSLLDVTMNGSLVASIPLAAVASIRVDAGNGNNTLVVSYSGAGLPSISYDSGSGGNDTLRLLGGVTTALDHALTGPASGSIALTGPIAGNITYAGVESTDTSGLTVSNHLFILPSAGSAAKLADGSSNLLLSDSGGAFAASTFKNPLVQFSIARGASTDTLTINGSVNQLTATTIIGSSSSPLASFGVNAPMNLASGRLFSCSTLALAINSTIAASQADIRADSIDITATGSLSTGQSRTTIQPVTTGISLDLGGNDVTTGQTRVLGLADAELDRIVARALVIGSASTGPIQVSADISRPSTTDIKIQSGSHISLSGGRIQASAGNVEIITGSNGKFEPAVAGFDINGASAKFGNGTSLAIDINGSTLDTQYTQLKVSGSVDLAGVKLALQGTPILGDGDILTIVSAVSVTGMFSGLPAGTLIPFGGLKLKIDYTPRSVTLTAVGPPRVTSPASVSSTYGDPLTYQVTASGFPASFAYSLEGTVPSGVQIGSSSGILSAPPTVPAGSYTFTIVVANGIGLPGRQSFTLDVGKRNLTVTADPLTVLFTGATTTGFTSTYSGFANGDTASVVNGTITYTGQATTAILPGTHAITPNVSALSAGNYSFTAVNGVLTIRNLVTLEPNSGQFVIGGRTNLNSLEFLARFETPVSPLAPSQISVIGGIVTAVNPVPLANDTRWIITVQPILDAAGQADIEAFVLQDTIFTAGSVGNPASNAVAVHVDQSIPLAVGIYRLAPSGQTTNSMAVTYRAVFSEAIDPSTISPSDFTANGAGGTGAGTVQSLVPVTTSQASAFDITVSALTGDGPLRLDLTGPVSDLAGNILASGFSLGETYILDHTAPVISGISRLDPLTPLTNRTAVTFRATFTEPVDPSSVTAADFQIGILSGSLATKIASVVPVGGSNGQSYDISITGIVGNGVIHAMMTGQVTDLAGNNSTGGYFQGDQYIIDQASPSVVSITSLTSGPTVSSTGSFKVVFSESVDPASVSVADFAVAATGSATGNVSRVDPVPNEPASFTVQMSGLSGAGTIGLVLPAEALILDLAGNPLVVPFANGDQLTLDPVVVSVSPSSVSEGFNLVSSVTLNRPLDTDITLVLTPTLVAGGAGAVDLSTRPIFLTVPAGTLVVTFAIPTVNDNIVEADEVFEMKAGQVSAAGRNVVLGQASAPGAIINDDSARISILPGSALEGSTLVMTVNLDQPADSDVTVDIGMRGSLLDTADFADIPSNQDGRVTIPAGQLSAAYSFLTTADEIIERDETVTFAISRLAVVGRAVSIGQSQAIGSILNDDYGRVSLLPGTAPEGQPVPFVLQLDKPADTEISLRLTPRILAGDSAGPRDFMPFPLTAVFLAGSRSATVSVATVDDNLVERDESFSVSAALLETHGRPIELVSAVGKGTIANDDNSVLRIAPTGAVRGQAAVFSAKLGTGKETTVGARVELPFPGYAGALSIASADLNDDGFTDVVYGAGQGLIGGQVRVFDGVNGSLLNSFAAFPGNAKGVVVATGDINGDGRKDIIAAAQGSAGLMKVFDGRTGVVLRTITAFPGYSGNVSVSAGDVDGDRKEDLVMASATGRVRVFSGASGLKIRDFAAFNAGANPVSVVAADLNGDGIREIVVGAANGAGSSVRVFSSTGTRTGGFTAFASSFKGGVTLAAIDINGDGIDEIVAATGPGGRGMVRVFNSDFRKLDEFFASEPGMVNGLFIG